MVKIFNNRTLAISQKVYGWLLRAYPPSHREKYGPAMAQLFRDQCRDAWSKSRNRGVTKLWLRVLPDLVKTSFIERLAALTKRKSMTDKMTALMQPRTVFLKVFAVVFLLILCATVAITFILPESYASTARIKVEPDEPAAATGISPGYDPYFIQTQFVIMQTQIVLDSVIDKLNLNVLWGKKYAAGNTLTTNESLEILKGRISLAPVRNTKLVSITVYSDDPGEAAQIANAIAEAYKDYRVKLATGLAVVNLSRLEQEFGNNEKQIERIRIELNALRQQVKIGNEISDNPPPQEQSYWDKKQYLDGLLEAHKTLYAKLEAAKLEAQIPKTVLVVITDPAVPGHAPVRPNKTLNIALGIVGGIFLASIAGGISVLIALKFRKRIGKTTAIV